MNDDELDARLRAVPRPPPADPEASEHPEDGLLIAYRAATLGEAETARIDAHVAGCSHCRRVLRALAEPVPPAVRARAREAALAAAPRRRGHRWLAPALLAAAATIVVFVAWPRGESPPGAYGSTGPTGGVQDVRSDDGATRRFLVDSRLRLDLAPVAAPETAEAPAVAAFSQRPNGPLVAVPAHALRRGQGGAVRVEGRAGELLGEAPGEVRLWVVFAVRVEDLRGLEGTQPPAGAVDGPRRFLEFPLELLGVSP